MANLIVSPAILGDRGKLPMLWVAKFDNVLPVLSADDFLNLPVKPYDILLISDVNGLTFLGQLQEDYSFKRFEFSDETIIGSDREFTYNNNGVMSGSDLLITDGEKVYISADSEFVLGSPAPSENGYSLKYSTGGSGLEIIDIVSGDVLATFNSTGIANLKRTFVTVSGQITASTSTAAVGNYQVYLVNTTNGAVTLEISSADILSGATFLIKDAGGNATTNPITLTTEGNQLFNGSTATRIINLSYASLSLVSDGNSLWTY